MIMCTSSATSLTAKWGHMKVTEYFLGFGPRLWSIRRGETEYGVKAIPAGGYVKILGMTQHRGGRPRRRAPHLPAAALPQPAPRGRGRLGHALRHGLRALVGPVRLHRCPAVQRRGRERLRAAGPRRRPGPRRGAAGGRRGGRGRRRTRAFSRPTSSDDHRAAAPAQPVTVRRRPRRPATGPWWSPRSAESRQRRVPTVASGSSSARPWPAAVRSRRSAGRGSSSGRWSRARSRGSARCSPPAGSRATSTTSPTPRRPTQAAKTGDRPQSIYGAARLAVQGAPGRSHATCIDVLAIDHHLRRDPQPVPHASPRRRPRRDRRLRAHPQPPGPHVPRRRHQARSRSPTPSCCCWSSSWCRRCTSTSPTR